MQIVRRAGTISSIRPLEGGNSFRRDIEGLRGIAVLVVVLYHCGLKLARGGFIGVDVFFVLSGYLITGLLVREACKTGRIRLMNFYARRVRRLLPAAAMMLMAVLGTGIFIYSPQEILFFGRAARATAAYSSNLFFAVNAADYFSPEAESNPMLHTWSLAVEEQFYLVWPLLVLLAFLVLRRSQRLLFWFVSAISAASFVYCLLLSAKGSPWAFYSPMARAWEFGIGGAGALLPGAFSIREERWRGLDLAGIAVVVASAGWLAAGGFSVWAVAAPGLGTVAALIVGSRAQSSSAAILLNTGPLQFLGKVSYSWYLWHWPFLLALAAWYPEAPPLYRLTAAGAALVIAATVHYFFENPIRFHPYLAARPGLSLALAAAITVTTIASGQLAIRKSNAMMADPRMRPILQAAESWADTPKGCLTPRGTNRVKPCVVTAPPEGRRVVAFGDSHITALASALKSASVRNGFALTFVAKAGCGAADLSNGFGGNEWRVYTSQCQEWRRQALRYIIAIKPDLVVTSTSTHFLRRESKLGEPLLAEWWRGIRFTLKALDDAGIPTLLVRDNPNATFNVNACLARVAMHQWYLPRCEMSRKSSLFEDVAAVEKQVAREFPKVRIMDLTDRYCEGAICPLILDNVYVLRDESHITREFSAHLAPDFSKAISAVFEQN